MIDLRQFGRRNSWLILFSSSIKKRPSNYEYPLRNGLCLDDARPLLQAGKVVLARLCSIFVELTQVQCLRSGHKTCKRIMQVLRPTLSHGTC